MATADRLVPLHGSPNFRDLGGYLGADGRRVGWGRVYRSGTLSRLTAADRATVTALGVGWVVDLRTHGEVEHAPDPDLGARRIHLPVIDGAIDVEGLTVTIETGDLASIPDGLLLAGTARIATGFLDQWSTFMAHLVANPDTTTLLHCTGGKDRTGWGSALLLRALGVAHQVVMEDYLLTNDCLAEQMAAHSASVRSIAAANQGIAEDEVDLSGLLGLLGVRASYLEAAFDAVDQQFGSFDSYLVDAIGCSEESIVRLRDDLLE